MDLFSGMRGEHPGNALAAGLRLSCLRLGSPGSFCHGVYDVNGRTRFIPYIADSLSGEHSGAVLVQLAIHREKLRKSNAA